MEQIKIIDNYNKLSLLKHNQIVDIINSDLNESILQKELEILSVLTDKSSKELEMLKIGDLKWALNQMQFLQHKPIPLKGILEFNLNGTDYVTETQIRDWSTGRYIDLMSFLQKPIEEQNEFLHWIIGTCITPKGEKYGDTGLEKISNDVYEWMPITLAMGLSSFFLTLFEALIKTTLTYLEPEMMKKEPKILSNRKMMNILRSAGAGS